MSASMIARFGRVIQVRRRLPGSYDIRGQYTDGILTRLNITASIQPVTSRERELLPEGTRLREMFNLFTITKLLPPRGAPPVGGDIVTINGDEFLVVSCEDYVTHQSPSNSIRYYKAQVERIEEGT